MRVRARNFVLGVLVAGLLAATSVIFQPNLGQLAERFEPQLMAQQAFPGATTVQSVQPLYSCDQAFTATGAANTAVTVTAPGQPGRVFYICTVDIVEVANAAVTGAAGPAPVFTTTNLVNNLVWWGSNATLGTGAQVSVLTLSMGVTPLKTLLPGTAFTIVTSGGQSTQSVRLNITGFYGTP